MGTTTIPAGMDDDMIEEAVVEATAGTGDDTATSSGSALTVAGVADADLSAAVNKVLWRGVRKTRNRMLELSDWTQLPDVPLTNKAAWATYRQALRDVPQTNTDPANITWPVAP